MTIQEVEDKLIEMQITKVDFANRLGLKQQAFGQWFSRRDIPLKHLKQVRSFFGGSDEILIVLNKKEYYFKEARDAICFLQGFSASID